MSAPTLAPATAMTAVIAVIPVYMAMSRTMMVARAEYSTQRKRLIPWWSPRSYLPRTTVPVRRWPRAASARNAATAMPTRMSTGGSGADSSLPGGPVG